MLGTDFKSVVCPYCNERLDIVVDGSTDFQEYIEDCQVCCQPITYRVWVDPEEISVKVLRENEY